MSKYAVIRLNGTQYKVTEGEELLVDKIGNNELEPEVLLVVTDRKAKIGKPYVRGAKVKLKVITATEKGKKIYVRKFRAKSRYRRKMGFRHQFSRLLVEKIS